MTVMSCRPDPSCNFTNVPAPVLSVIRADHGPCQEHGSSGRVPGYCRFRGEETAFPPPQVLLPGAFGYRRRSAAAVGAADRAVFANRMIVWRTIQLSDSRSVPWSNVGVVNVGKDLRGGHNVGVCGAPAAVGIVGTVAVCAPLVCGRMLLGVSAAAAGELLALTAAVGVATATTWVAAGSIRAAAR